jgi:cobalt/nickel transport system permease protein
MMLAQADLRAKLLLALGLVGASMALDLVGLALLLLAAQGLLLASGLGLRHRVVGLAALAALPFVVLNALLVGGTPLAALGPLALSQEGFALGLRFGGRGLLAVLAALWVVRTTTPREALHALRRWPRLAVALAGALRFAPLAAEDVARAREAQQLRGRAAPTGARGMAALMVPVMVGTVRRGRTLQEALDLAAFGSGPRTVRPSSTLGALDLALAAMGLALLGLAAWVALRGGAP